MRLRFQDGLSFLLLAGGVALAVIGGDEHWSGAAGVCLVSMAFALALSWKRVRKVALDEGIPDFLTVFLAFQLLNKTLTIVSLAAGDRHLKYHEAADLVEPRYAVQAELVHLAAMVLFTAGWLIVERVWRARLPLVRQDQSIPSLLAFYALVTVAAFFLQRASDVLSVGMLSTIMQYSALATVGILLASKSSWGAGGTRVVLSVLMLAPPGYLALTSGTKGALVVAALPILMAGLARGWRRVLWVLASFAIAMLVVGIPLSQEMRKANWESYGAHEQIGIAEGLSRVMERYSEDGVAAVLETTTIQFAHRASSAQLGGFVMRVADQDGSIGVEPIKLLPAIFVPRLFWSDKPMFQPGAWFTWYLGRAPSPESATSATATMLGTETYWMFGATGSALVVALGILYAVIWKMLVSLSRQGQMGFAGMYAMLGTAVRFEETHVVYAISAPIITLVYVYLLVHVERFARILAAPRVRQ